jgi:septum site-determining protein MinD
MATNYVFTIAGSKGGVGKTTTSINLGACFADAGLATAVVEVDLPMANLVDFVDLDIDVGEAVTLHDVLAGEAAIGEAVYEIRDRLSVVPSGTDLEGYARSDVDRLEPAIERLRWHFDVIIMDTPAGMGDEVIRPIELADETVLISTPRVSSVRNVRNTKQVAERADTEVRGLILSKSGTGASPGAERIADFIGLDLLGHVPEDDAVPHSQDQGAPVVEYAPNSGAAIAYGMIAEKLMDDSVEATTAGAPTGPADPVVADAAEAADTGLAPEKGEDGAVVATSDGGSAATAETAQPAAGDFRRGASSDPESRGAEADATSEEETEAEADPEDGDTGGGTRPAVGIGHGADGDDHAGADTGESADTTDPDGVAEDASVAETDGAADGDADEETGADPESETASTETDAETGTEPEPETDTETGTDTGMENPDADAGAAGGDTAPETGGDGAGVGEDEPEAGGRDGAEPTGRADRDGAGTGADREPGAEGSGADASAEEDRSLGARIRSAIGL